MSRYEFQPNDGRYQSKQKKQPPESSRFFENKNTNQNGSNRSNPCPNCINGSNWQGLGNFVQQCHTNGKCNKKPNHPQSGGHSGCFFCLTQTSGKTYLKKSGNNKQYPIHNYGLIINTEGTLLNQTGRASNKSFQLSKLTIIKSC